MAIIAQTPRLYRNGGESFRGDFFESRLFTRYEGFRSKGWCICAYELSQVFDVPEDATYVKLVAYERPGKMRQPVTLERFGGHTIELRAPDADYMCNDFWSATWDRLKELLPKAKDKTLYVECEYA